MADANEALLKGMSPDQIKAVQQKLRASGYNVKVDGRLGPETLAAYAAMTQKSDLAKIDAEARLKEAEAKIKEAEAKVGEANAKTTTATATLKKAETEEEKRKSAEEPLNKAFKFGLQAGPAAAGLYFGARHASNIGKKYVDTQKLKNAELSRLAAEGRAELHRKGGPRAFKLHGIQKAGKSLGLTKTKGPLGLIPAAGFGAAALSERGAGHMLEPGLGQDVLFGVGTGSAVAGGSILAKRAMSRGLEGNPPNARDLAVLHEIDSRLDPSLRVGSVQDRDPAHSSRVKNPKSAPPTKAEIEAALKAGVRTPGWYGSKDQLKRIMKMVGKSSRWGTPVLAGLVGGMAAHDARAAGGSGGEAAGAAASEVGDMLLLGGPSAYREARAAGYGRPASVAAGMGSILDSAVTGGMGRTMLDPDVDPGFKRSAAANVALPSGSPLNAAAAMESNPEAVRRALAYLLLGQTISDKETKNKPPGRRGTAPVRRK